MRTVAVPGEAWEIVAETPRLLLRHMTEQDGEFIVDLLNQPSFFRYIGDKGVRTAEDARRYIQEGPRASYERYGFGLYTVVLRESGEAIGMSGLVKREIFEEPDLGVAFLPGFWGRGYARESAVAVLRLGRETWGHERVLAVIASDNDASFRLAESLGFRPRGMVRLVEEGPELALWGL